MLKIKNQIYQKTAELYQKAKRKSDKSKRKQEWQEHMWARVKELRKEREKEQQPDYFQMYLDTHEDLVE